MDNPLYVTPSIRGHGCSPALEPSHADGWESPVTFVLPHMDDDSDADTPGAAVDSGVAAQGAGERPTTALEVPRCDAIRNLRAICDAACVACIAHAYLSGKSSFWPRVGDPTLVPTVVPSRVSPAVPGDVCNG